MKTRLEVSREAAGAQDVDTAPVTLPSGVVYQDVRIGGGSLPKKGDLVVLQYRCSIHTLEHRCALRSSSKFGSFTKNLCLRTLSADFLLCMSCPEHCSWALAH